MVNTFLLTYCFENQEGMLDRGYQWHKNKKEMLEHIEDMKEYLKDFTVNQAIEILQFKSVEFK